ncbi:actin-like ATPase domain-containing protein [Rhizophagus irregularis]|uniref:Actin-like ATPase domain-containing protein n=1 Tax=Rhizophagus irregularis TaxID=588596 RepID=A0A2N1NUS9_9GLOM|nr:actin-like ATPase domain-containing protein [Rhizophagus irregularis]
MLWVNDMIRVIVGLDFGSTYSGFSLYHVDSDDIKTTDYWSGDMGKLKTNTVLQYDDNYKDVKLWGHQALYRRPDKKSLKDKEMKPVELFKLYLGNCLEKYRPKLPVDYKKAISDYLCEIGKVIKETIPKYWMGIDFMENVLLILPVPAEYSELDKAIMRECAFNAGLINNRFSRKLQFTTEPEAAAVYCTNNILKQYNLIVPGTTFMIVDCGGGTVDLTTHTLLEDNTLGEITERSGDFCGSTFIDKEFIKLLKHIVGNEAIDLLSERHYGQLQYLIQDFCQNAKIPFNGDEPGFSYDLDFEESAPVLLQYVTGSVKDLMEDKEWMIEIDFNTIKSLFDPIVDRIIKMIRIQLDNSSKSEKCSAIFLVGGFSQSKYLQKRIIEEFIDLVGNISIPSQPDAAVLRGAAIYGKSLHQLKSMNRFKLEMVSPKWKEGDPPERRTSHGLIHKFRRIVKRKTEVEIDQEIDVGQYAPIVPNQTKLSFDLYYTKEQDAVYCDEPGVEFLGEFLN